ncbi:hypothetical protein FKM82_028437, partial [Ascaphus truei]
MSCAGEVGAAPQTCGGECYLSALCVSAWRRGAGPPVSPPELLQFCARLRRVDKELQEMRGIFQGSDLPSADQTELKLSELLQPVVFLLFKYPALNSNCVQEAITTLIYRAR